MNKGYCGVALIVSGLVVFCVRHLAAAWMAASRSNTANIVRSFDSIQRGTGGGLFLLGIAALLIGVLLVIFEIRAVRRGRQ